jgi:isocitrate/isopropylmalate dehydrogenase
MGKYTPPGSVRHPSVILTDSFRSKYRTRDMGGEATTHEFTRAILDKMDTL